MKFFSGKIMYCCFLVEFKIVWWRLPNGDQLSDQNLHDFPLPILILIQQYAMSKTLKFCSLTNNFCNLFQGPQIVKTTTY